MNMLEEIIRSIRNDIKKRKKVRPISEMKIDYSPRRSLSKAIEHALKVPLIAEIKRASPSMGEIKSNIDVVETSKAMVRGGAIALSVLTEPNYFKGDLNFLPKIRKAVNVPVMRKDFIVEEYQLYESAALWADAVLLIAEILDKKLERFIKLARKLGMESLVEVSDEKQVELAYSSGARLIGINNRDLKNMQVDIVRTARLAPLIPNDATIVSESGIRSPVDINFIMDAGADAVLVGTAIMQAPNVEQYVRMLVNVR